MSLHLLDKLVVEHIALCDSQNAALVKKVLAFIKRMDSMLMVYTGTARGILMKVMMF